MSKLEQASEDVIKFIEDIIVEGDYDAFASFRFFNCEKQKELVKVSKASATTEYFAKTTDLCTIFVNEKIWDRLDDRQRGLLVRNGLNGLYYDDEKGKLILEQPNLQISSECYLKFGAELVDAAAAVTMALKQIKDEEKKAKEEKQAKKKKWTPEQEN